MKKITTWSKNNKISFNEEKSKVMVISRRKRKENKEINIYLNNKPLQQVTTINYLGIIIDNKFKFSEHKQRSRKMWQTNTQFIQISKTNTGSQPQSVADYIKRGDITSPSLRCPGMGRRYEVWV
jgi:hypothetical protein